MTEKLTGDQRFRKSAAIHPDKGMIISGGGALLRNLDKLISIRTGVPCFVAEDALLCVAKGTGIVLESLEIYKRSIMSKK